MIEAHEAHEAAAWLVDRVREIAGHRFYQGRRRPPLTHRGRDAAVALVAESRLHRVGELEARALVGWAEGTRRADLVRGLIPVFELVRLQAEGRRCVAIGGTDAPALEMCLHDLRHLEKFFDPLQHHQQVAFFRWIARVQEGKAWAEHDAAYDPEWRVGRDAVLSDMNGSPIFLFAVLKMKLKMAVRRKLARARGLVPPDRGVLFGDEVPEFDRAFERYLDVLELSGEVREAARRISAKGSSGGAAEVLLAWLS